MFQLWNRDPNKKNGEENGEKKRQGKKKKDAKQAKSVIQKKKKEEWFHQEVSSVCFTQKFIDDGVGFGYEK